MTPDWKALREEFPALAKWTFLNTATYGQLPRSAAQAIDRHLARRDELACDDYLSWFDDMDAIRESCARLVHCESPDIAFVLNASTGLAALVLGGFGSAPGAVIGGLLIGLIEQFAGVYLPDGVKDVAPYLVLIAVLILYPRGILGESHGRRV